MQIALLVYKMFMPVSLLLQKCKVKIDNSGIFFNKLKFIMQFSWFLLYNDINV